MTVNKVIKDFLRPLRDVVFAFGGFSYDFYRFFKYAGWRGFADSDKRQYKAVKIYHRMEKSLSFKNRDKSSGVGAAFDFVQLLEKNGFNPSNPGFHEVVGLKVLNDFLLSADINSKDRNYLENFLKENKQVELGFRGGATYVSAKEISSGQLENPEKFFLTRYSVRDFKQEKVSKDLVVRALRLAMKTPSVCNRQAWHVYHIDKRDSIDRALSLQNGNRGFGHQIPCLLVITADLSAFDTGIERYQHWIDGGMFSMAIVMALHSLGVSSCCLNWSKGPIADLKLRKLINIEKKHTVMMMLAVGYASDNLNVCYSARKPCEDIYTYLD